MSEFNVSIPAGEKRRLKTGGKYCPADVLVNAEMPARAIEKDVNFHDYDGTLLYSYTLAEAQTLSQLPPFPEHEGLICQGWNWTLDAVRALTRPMTIGAMYTTDDGATRLYLELPQNMTVQLCFRQSASNGVTIDWGDGSDVQTRSGTGEINTTHAYAEGGSYVISLKVTSGTLTLGPGVSGYGVFGPNAYSYAPIYNSLVKVEIGNGVRTLGTHGFTRCFSLKTISTTNAMQYIEASAFVECHALQFLVSPANNLILGGYTMNSNYSLRGISINENLDGLGSGFAYRCRSLRRIDIPDNTTIGSAEAFVENNALRMLNTKNGINPNGAYGVCECHSLTECKIADSTTAIATYAFYNCYSLRKLAFPSGIASIAANAFGGCSGMREYDFTKCTAVPTLANANAFTGIQADCVIKVPAALYDEWIAATNWATYASQIVAV